MAAPWWARVPPEYRQGHYGPLLVGYILYQHYQCRVPQPLIHEQLREWGIDISTGQLHRLLCEHQRDLSGRTAAGAAGGVRDRPLMSTPMTRERVTRATMATAPSSGNAYFTYFRTTERKSRQSFLETLQGESPLLCAQRVCAAVSPIVSVGGEVLAGAQLFESSAGSRLSAMADGSHRPRDCPPPSGSSGHRSGLTGEG